MLLYIETDLRSFCAFIRNYTEWAKKPDHVYECRMTVYTDIGRRSIPGI